MPRTPKPLEKMTKKELIRLCRRVHKANSLAGQNDTGFLSWLSMHLVPETTDGSPVQDPKTTPPGRYQSHIMKEGVHNPWIPLTSAELSARITEWTETHNKDVLPATVALEKAVYGKDY